jgi:hypothetical protein
LIDTVTLGGDIQRNMPSLPGEWIIMDLEKSPRMRNNTHFVDTEKCDFCYNLLPGMPH